MVEFSLVWVLKSEYRDKACVVTIALESQKDNTLETKLPSFSESDQTTFSCV